jgi:hypothetical protein
MATRTLKFLSTLVAVAFAVVVATTAARADQISEVSLAESMQDVTVTSNGPSGPADISLGTLANGVYTLSGSGSMIVPGSASNVAGSWSLTTTGMVEAVQPENEGAFAVDMNGATSTFSFTAAGVGTITGTATITEVQDGTPNPQFDGTWTLDNTTEPFDFTVNDLTLNGPATDFGVIAFGTSGTTSASTLSAGEFVTPEPASLGLFGLGLIGLALIIRRQARAEA